MTLLPGETNSPTGTSASSASPLAAPFPLFSNPFAKIFPGTSKPVKEKGSTSNKGPEKHARVIVALSFGATHTSVAYLNDYDRHSNNLERAIDDIYIVQNWPWRVTNESVPCKISYSPTVRGCEQWGYDIDHVAEVHDSLRQRLEDASTYQELISLRNLVNEAVTVPGLSVSVPPSLHKSPEQMAADFLRNVAKTFRDEYSSMVGNLVLDKIPLDLVVSYPSLWPEAVKRRYFQVIEAAFDLALFPTLRHIYFLAEAEAISQCCVLSKIEFLRACGIGKGMSVIVCDTGDSSVKATATSYTFDQVQPELKLRKIGYLARANAGWASVEDDFQSLLVVKRHIGYGDLLRPMDPCPDTDLRNHWDMILQKFQPVMHGFDDMSRLAYPVQLPRGFQAARDDPKRGILNGCLSLSPDDLKELFDPSIKSLIQMLSDQIELADHAGTSAKAIILSGTFVNQKYVFKKLETFAQTRGARVVGVEHGGNTIRGSVLHALGLNTTPVFPVIKMAHHYGIGHHGSHPQPDSSNHVRKMPELVEWILGKGEVVFSDADEARNEQVRILRRYNSEDCVPGGMSRVVVVSYGGDTPSGRFQSLEPQSTRSFDLEFGLSLIPENQRRPVSTKAWLFGKTKSLYFDVELCISFSISQSTIKASVSCGGKLLGEKKIWDTVE